MNKTALAVIGILSVVSTNSHAVVFTLSGNMDVLQAGTNGGFGAGTGNGTGTISGSYDDVTNLLNYALTWKDLSSAVTNAHFHNGAVGVSGGVDLGIPAPWASPYTNSATLNAAQEANLLAGNWYVNIHTSNFGGGEIRGQVIVPEPATSAAIAALAMLGYVAIRRRRQ